MVLALSCCTPKEDGIPIRAEKSRAIIIDNQGICWKANRWETASDRSSIYSKKGRVIFDSTYAIFVLKGKTSWHVAAKTLLEKESNCIDFTYKKEKAK